MKKTFLKFSFEFVPAFWPYAIYLELLENREWFAGFFHKKLTYLQSSGHHRQLKNVISNQNNEKLADTFNLALPKKKILKFPFGSVPAFWPHAIYLELLENREWFADFFHKKKIVLVCNLEWCKGWSAST